MAKFTHSSVLDAALNVVKNGAAVMTACSALPSTYAEATATYKLADIAIDSSDFTGPSAGDGASGSRKVTVVAQSTVPIDSSGTATHVAICSSDTLLHAGTCTSIVLTSGQTVNFPSWDIEFAPPTA
jgi:hypothetical protein